MSISAGPEVADHEKQHMLSVKANADLRVAAAANRLQDLRCDLDTLLAAHKASHKARKTAS